MSIKLPHLPSDSNVGPKKATRETFPLLDELLAEQQQLQTPVARFAALHESVPAQAPNYRDLIPLTAPGAGEQYAFEVDLDRCSGCKSCVAGCHSMNGLDEHETWRDVGLIVGGSQGAAYQQTVTTACHHCADPACLNGCPVLAYEKDPITGVVRHLDDQCIGCQYCVLKCPYEVPKYNDRLGIVRKCDLCHSRLSAGEAPACVQACPTQAIRIVNVSRSTATTSFLEAAPAPEYTKPTTRYVSKNSIPSGTVAADAGSLRTQPGHAPLVWMLVLTQAGAGLQLAALLPGTADWVRLTGGILFFLGLVASVGHLGQPARAWRIFLNLRKSWLSREAVVFGAAFGVLASAEVARHTALLSTDPQRAFNFFAMGTVLAGVFCSVMIYADTQREFWRIRFTATKFFGTVLLAAASVLNVYAFAALLLSKLAVERLAARGSSENPRAPASHTARVLAGPLRGTARARVVAALASLVLAPFAPPGLLLGVLLIGELCERHLYFRAVAAPKMPGVPTP